MSSVQSFSDYLSGNIVVSTMHFLPGKSKLKQVNKKTFEIQSNKSRSKQIGMERSSP